MHESSESVFCSTNCFNHFKRDFSVQSLNARGGFAVNYVKFITVIMVVEVNHSNFTTTYGKWKIVVNRNI